MYVSLQCFVSHLEEMKHVSEVQQKFADFAENIEALLL